MSIGRIRALRGVGSAGIQVNYSPGKAYTFAQQQKVDSKSIVDRLLVPHKLQKRSPDILKCSVMANTSRKTLPLSSQRNRLRRQWKGALVAALRSRGMNADGRPLEGESNRLVGTLELVVFQAQCWGEASENFVDKAGKIVDVLLKNHAGESTSQSRRETMSRSSKTPDTRK